MNKIREVRQERGLRLVDAAKLFGIGCSTLWLIENGYAERASEKTRKKIAAGLGLKVEELFPEQ